MRITSKGQVTIPIEIREQLGLLPETEVEFEVVGDAVQLTKVQGPGRRARRLLDRLAGSATGGLTTDEIMALTRND